MIDLLPFSSPDSRRNRNRLKTSMRPLRRSRKHCAKMQKRCVIGFPFLDPLFKQSQSIDVGPQTVIKLNVLYLCRRPQERPPLKHPRLLLVRLPSRRPPWTYRPPLRLLLQQLQQLQLLLRRRNRTPSCCPKTIRRPISWRSLPRSARHLQPHRRSRCEFNTCKHAIIPSRMKGLLSRACVSIKSTSTSRGVRTQALLRRLPRCELRNCSSSAKTTLSSCVAWRFEARQQALSYI